MSSITLFARFRDDPENENIWQRLVDHYGPWVFSWASKSIGRKDVAEDIVQTVFLRMYQRRHALIRKTETSPRKWISTVAFHLIADWKRDGLRSHLSLDDNHDESASLVSRLEAHVVDLDAYLELAERCDLYVSAWEALAKSDMVSTTVCSFLLRVRERLSSEDVAARLGLGSSQAVNTNVRRVRAFLANQMGLPQQDSRSLDQLDLVALESSKCALRLKEIAQQYGSSDSKNPE